MGAMMRKYRLGRVEVRNSKQIIGSYRGYRIEINREDDGRFYIYVCNPDISFGTAYDGWWGEARNTIDEALQQAFKGSLITEQHSNGGGE